MRPGPPIVTSRQEILLDSSNGVLILLLDLDVRRRVREQSDTLLVRDKSLIAFRKSLQKQERVCKMVRVRERGEPYV